MQADTLQYLTEVVGHMSRVTELIRKDTHSVIGESDVVSLIKHYSKLRDAVEQIKVARKALDEIEERLSREQVPDAFKRAGVKTINVETVGRVTVSYRWGCSMLDKEKGMEYLRNTGNASLIQETVNASTLAAFAKNLAETEGAELPQDVFKTSLNPFTSITKA